MRAETYAVVNLAALNLIEAMSAAYYATEAEAAARHAFRVREMLKKIAAALEQELGHDAVEAKPAPPGTIPPSATAPALKLVSSPRRSAVPDCDRKYDNSKY
ncbi:hypothetical protein PZN02_002903 [Sinorhizobium garamanticum]|uniref:Uncharacterized protein n=1 Tax=Sinorhizobium garamanticum TaxID=680247 RepID=A0ABY8D8H3_9HYPH|nr:hypothetical protein [Sinorhizobium garamanticum]WEX86602.1 hypothetical protein PZN02_002903 [Sinorhizobium garamanticum]